MKQINLMDKYPVNVLEIDKELTKFETIDEILDYLKLQIDAHPVATYISIFDHYQHTTNLEGGVMASEIISAKNIICCFGKQLPSPVLLSIKPRSIGVAELENKFVISFMDAPNPEAHQTMLSWVESIKNK